jgi:catechol 2,3-dioxygenase-like lactoylglutathione lyase family enzyme
MEHAKDFQTRTKFMAPKSGGIALGHVGINVSDIEISKAFYQEVLSLRVGGESHQLPLPYASMTRDGRTVLTLWEDSGMRSRNCPPALHRLAFVTDSAEEVNRTKRLLENLGARWSEKDPLHSQSSSSAVVHFEDPDGIPIELYSTDRADTDLEQNTHIGSAARVPERCTA